MKRTYGTDRVGHRFVGMNFSSVIGEEHRVDSGSRRIRERKRVAFHPPIKIFFARLRCRKQLVMTDELQHDKQEIIHRGRDSRPSVFFGAWTRESENFDRSVGFACRS